ncbi:MAG: ferrous iron transport protein A [Magnetococcales bacterium]|nr:ferrous iron transport protein A [Magnetococcales bacterium]
MTLADLKNGETAKIHRLMGDETSKRRLMALGIVKGKEISLEVKAPMGDPRIYSILGYRLTIRNEDARNILVDS